MIPHKPTFIIHGWKENIKHGDCINISLMGNKQDVKIYSTHDRDGKNYSTIWCVGNNSQSARIEFEIPKYSSNENIEVEYKIINWL